MTLKFTFYILLLLITVILGILNFKRLNNPLKLILLLVLIVLSSETSSRAFKNFYPSTFPIYHLLMPIQMVFYIFIYSYILRIKGYQKMAFKFLAVFAILFSISNTLLFQSIDTFPSYPLFLLSILTVVFSLNHFVAMLQKPEEVSPLKDPFFWFSAGNLIFYCITFFLFGFFNPLFKFAGGMPPWVYHIIYAANLLLYSTYFMSLWYGRKSIHTK